MQNNTRFQNGNTWLWILGMLAAFGLAGYTQLAHLTSVPGLQFDEAWQGLLAYRIESESGFLPLSAMNSYTGPIPHYLIAAAFRAIGSPSLLAMRATYAAMNLTSLVLFIGLLIWMRERLAAAWFTLLWGLLPLSVHDHRFYVELTGFHGLCLALLLWGAALWKKQPLFSTLLVFLALIAGVATHILFTAVFMAGAYMVALAFPKEFLQKRFRSTLSLLSFSIAAFAFRMGVGLHKFLPFILCAAMCALALWAMYGGRLWARLPQIAQRVSKWLWIAALPFLIGFVALHWNGSWPYAQATGALRAWWFPLNAAVFVWLALTDAKKESRGALTTNHLWFAFLSVFLVTSALILKQSSRYYMVAAILAMLWVAVRLARLPNRRTQLLIAALFIGWNLYSFQTFYIQQYEDAGATTVEFKLGIFHDNARDFRPFQKVFAWAVVNHCQQELRWFEDDRFMLPIEFLRLTAPPIPVGTGCPWNRDNLFFSHIPDYDPRFSDLRTEQNTKPPVENVKFLAHFNEWGDLAFWHRRWF